MNDWGDGAQPRDEQQTAFMANEPPRQERAKRRYSTGRIAGIVGVVAIIIALIAVAMRMTGGTSGADSNPEAASAEALTTYLTALSEGDAETARSFVWVERDHGQLNEEVLAKSRELAPISDIAVDESAIVVSEESGIVSATVPATFMLGETRVDRDFSLSVGSRQVSDPQEWSISNGLALVSFGRVAGLSPSLNGVPMGETERVFIGAYDVGFGSERVALEGDSDVLLLHEKTETQVTAKLTDEAVKEYREIVRADLTECLALTTLSTPCGMDVSGTFANGEKAVDGTVERTLTEKGDAALDSLEVELDPDKPAHASSRTFIDVSVETDVTKGDGSWRVSVMTGAGVLLPTVDLTAENLSVTWEARY
ncbi:MAG: hypothetical protein ACTH1Z_10070 [Ancrocorticia sp.]|uniref:hypothetical protein n=2 Tax=Ancrocorticia sp. TaxID=2593684 RepID=UPI003F92FFBA